jgi:hypothetical protein
MNFMEGLSDPVDPIVGLTCVVLRWPYHLPSRLADNISGALFYQVPIDVPSFLAFDSQRFPMCAGSCVSGTFSEESIFGRACTSGTRYMALLKDH